MGVTILQGDVRAMLATLPAESVQCVVTSPPYFQLRDYGVAGQIGMEATPAEFIATLVGVFEEVRRVLRPDGVVFCNIGDSYAGSGKGPTGHNGIGDQEQRQGFRGGSNGDFNARSGNASGSRKQEGDRNRDGLGGVAGIPAKNLLLIPQRFAIAMQDAGWYVRSQIAWCKTSAMPEPVKDRPSSAWEPIWMFTRSKTYFWDAEAVRQPHTGMRSPESYGRIGALGGAAETEAKSSRRGEGDGRTSFHYRPGAREYNPLGGNLRNYWLLGPEPSREEHYAAFPSEIPRRCILAATSEKGQCPACGSPWVRSTSHHYESIPGGSAMGKGNNRVKAGDLDSMAAGRRFENRAARVTATIGWAPSCQCDAGDPVPQTVLDPFLGSGTTALVADQLGRNAIGCELSPTYAEMARRRITNDCPMFTDVEVAG